LLKFYRLLKNIAKKIKVVTFPPTYIKQVDKLILNPLKNKIISYTLLNSLGA